MHKLNPKTITKRVALLVEGDDDFALFRRLVTAKALETQIDLFIYGGKPKLRKFLSGFAKTEGFRTALKAIAVTRDADDDEAPFDSICGALRDAGLPVPTAELTIAGGKDQPKVAALVVAGAERIGAIEDMCLCALLLDPCRKMAQDYIDTIVASVAEPPKSKSKAVLHALLATKPTPGLPIGLASDAGYIDLMHAAFEDVRNLLDLVVNIEVAVQPRL